MSASASTSAYASAPALPADCWLQVALLRSGVVYRISDDGRLLVTVPGQDQQEQQPLSKWEPGLQRISAQGHARLRQAIADVSFFELPLEVPGVPVSGALVNNQQASPQPVVFTVRAEPAGSDGLAVRSVEVVGDPASPHSLGPLAALWTALDLEALGGWLGE
ncbi:MAG: hypothetical protein GXP62_16745 [Oligoflexia bacterium]|nr:hypothetical protein [Oligoflexia bacterium]